MATQGPLSAGTGADDSSVGTVAWGNPTRIIASDNSYATISVGNATSHYLKATDFGFSIPTGATIDGITVSIERKRVTATSVTDSRVRIVKGGTIGSTDKADTVTNWPSSDTVKTYGGSSDLWGESWSAADINASTFGVVLSVVAVGNPIPVVDHVSITVAYTASANSLTGIMQGVATASMTMEMTNALTMASFGVATATATLTISNAPTKVDFSRWDGYLNTLPVKYYAPEPAVSETNQLNPPKQDTDTDPIEIRPESGFLFSQKDFSHGMGQDYFHVEGRDVKKFFASEGYDVSEPDKLSHLNVTAEAVDSASIGVPFQIAGLPLVVVGNEVKRGNGAFPGTWTAETVGAVAIYDALGQGSVGFAGVNDVAAPLYTRAAGGTTWAAYQSGGTNITLGGGACTKLAYIKDRLMCVGGTASRSIYEVTGSTATPTAIRTLAAGWSYVDIWEGGRFIYATAVNTDRNLSALYVFGLNAAATAIEEKASSSFPENTIIFCGTGYLDTILMGGGVFNSSGGYDPIYLQGFPDTEGQVQWVIIRQEKGSGSTDLSVRVIRPKERSVLMGWSTKATSASLYAREGLAVHHLARGAFAHHLKKVTTAATPAKVTGITVYKGRVLFSVAGDGLYYEDIGTPVAQAEFISSVSDWGNAGYKVHDTIDGTWDPLPASTSVTVDYAVHHPADSPTWSPAISSTTLNETGKTARLSNIKERRFVIRIRSNASGSTSPEIRSFSVRSNPAPDQAEWRLKRTIQLYDYDRKGDHGEPFYQDPDDVRDTIMDLAYSWIRLTEEGITWTAWVDKILLLEPEQAIPRGTQGESRRSAFVLQLRMLGVKD